MSRSITYKKYGACDLPENGTYDEILLQYDDDTDDFSTTAATENVSIGNTDSYVYFLQAQPLESDVIKRRVYEIRGDISSQESNAVQNRRSQMTDADEASLVELSWLQIGSKPLNLYTTKHLTVACFPELFLNGIGDPTTQVRQRDVTIANAGEKWFKFCVKN